MLRVALSTAKRLLLDKTVIIALFIVPLIIIVAFSAMSLSAPEHVPLKIGVLSEQASALTSAQREAFNVFYAPTEEDLVDSVIKGRVAAGFLFEQSAVSKVYSSNAEFGEWVLQAFRHPAPVQLTTQGAENSKKMAIQTILNFLINYMMFSMIFIAIDIVTLKRLRIMHRINAMPLSDLQIFAGHLIAFLSLLALQIVEINIAIYLVVGIPLSASLLWGILILVLLMAIVLSLGLLVTRFTSNLSLVPLFCNGLMIPLMMASGTFMPVDNHPVLSKLKFVTPQYWVVDAIGNLNQGSTEVALHALVLGVMALLVFALATVSKNKFSAL